MDLFSISLSPSQTLWTVVGVALVSHLYIEISISSFTLMTFLYSLCISSSNKRRHVDFSGSSSCSWRLQHTWRVSIFLMLVVRSWQQWRCSVFSGRLSSLPSLSTESLPGTPWPNILDRYFVNSPNSTLHISLSMESSISTIMNCTRNTAMLSESVSRTYFIHSIVFHHFIGPNELSIRDVESIAPLMGSNGFQRGPCKWYISYLHNMISQFISLACANPPRRKSYHRGQRNRRATRSC